MTSECVTPRGFPVWLARSGCKWQPGSLNSTDASPHSLEPTSCARPAPVREKMTCQTRARNDTATASAILQWNVRDRSTPALGNGLTRPFPSMFDGKEYWYWVYGGPGYRNMVKYAPEYCSSIDGTSSHDGMVPAPRTAWDFGGLERWRAGYW